MVRQEIWALLLTHYAIRALMYEAIDPEVLDPLRMSFIRTLRNRPPHDHRQAGFFPPNRLATCLRHAIAEILKVPTRPRRHRTYPRVTKRAAAPSSREKPSTTMNIRHRGPPDIDSPACKVNGIGSKPGVEASPVRKTEELRCRAADDRTGRQTV